MLLRNSARRSRRGATLAECAVVSTVLFFLLLGIVVGGLGVFRYQQVANLAREGARWASVRGSQYQQETQAPAVTRDDIFNQAILPKAAGLSLTSSDVVVTLNTPNGSVPWDNSNRSTFTVLSDGQVKTNTVSVTVTYQWFPEVPLLLGVAGPITLTSRSEMPMSY